MRAELVGRNRRVYESGSRARQQSALASLSAGAASLVRLQGEIKAQEALLHALQESYAAAADQGRDPGGAELWKLERMEADLKEIVAKKVRCGAVRLRRGLFFFFF